MPLREFIDFWNVAQDREAQEQHYLAWCICLPFMDKDHFVSFPQYHARLMGENIDKRPNADIIAEVEEIRRKAKENGNEYI